jgi:SDR family mycofactocin-dependent oxidoreductase
MAGLEGRVALVTGGARGQGRAHAQALAKAGAAVFVTDIAAQIESAPYPLATQQDLDETVRLIRESGGEAHGRVADVREAIAMEDLVAEIVREKRRLDILVANAAICSFSTVVAMSDDMWHDIISVNLTGAFNSIRAALRPMMSARYGRIVATASGMGRGGAPNLGHYCASKWGLIGLVKAVALETAEHGITANVVCPTAVGTGMLLNQRTFDLYCPDIPNPTLEDMRPRAAAMNPMQVPWLEPEDITRAVMYFTEDRGVMTGTVLEVNLGSTANRS